jgi:hypothetical protein
VHSQPPKSHPIMSVAEEHGLAELVRASGEIFRFAGNAFSGAVDLSEIGGNYAAVWGAMALLLGDLQAAIEFLCVKGIVDRAAMSKVRDGLLSETLAPAARDGLGRPINA